MVDSIVSTFISIILPIKTHAMELKDTDEEGARQVLRTNKDKNERRILWKMFLWLQNI